MAAGITTFLIVSNLLVPSANDASRYSIGTDFNVSSTALIISGKITIVNVKLAAIAEKLICKKVIKK